MMWFAFYGTYLHAHPGSIKSSLLFWSNPGLESFAASPQSLSIHWCRGGRVLDGTVTSTNRSRLAVKFYKHGDLTTGGDHMSHSRGKSIDEGLGTAGPNCQKLRCSG